MVSARSRPIRPTNRRMVNDPITIAPENAVMMRLICPFVASSWLTQ